MNPVAQLLADLQAGPIEADDLAARIAAFTDAELAEFEQLAGALFDSIRTGETVVEGGSVVEMLTRITDTVDIVRLDAERRIAEAADAEAQIQALADRMAAVMDETNPDEAGDGDGTDEEAEGDNAGEAEPVEQPEEAGDPANDAEARQPEPVAAGARVASPVAIQRLAARSANRARPTPQTRQSQGATTIVAGGDLRDFTAGQEIPSLERLAEAFANRSDALRRSRSGAAMHVASIVASYPEERRLGQDAARNEALIAAVNQQQALVAAGGPCAPAAPIYEQFAIASDARPFRDSLNAFNASRAGVIVTPSPVWTAFADGVSIWTQTDDADAVDDDNVRKPCVRVDCDDPVTYRTYAIPVCVTVGNWFERSFPERLQAILTDIAAWQARFAERALLDILGTLSETSATTKILGAARDILTVLQYKVDAWREINRVDDNYTLNMTIQRWVRGVIRSDIIRNLPYGTLDEQMALADMTIDRWFANMNVRPTWTWEGENGVQELSLASQDYPNTVKATLWHPGAIGLLDEGRIDLGVQRDSTLNAANDMQIWGETFEGLFYQGVHRPHEITLELCPTGEVAGSADIADLVCTGS